MPTAAKSTKTASCQLGNPVCIAESHIVLGPDQVSIAILMTYRVDAELPSLDFYSTTIPYKSKFSRYSQDWSLLSGSIDSKLPHH